MTLRALEGFTVGITADRRWTEQAELLQRRGAAVLHGPTIKTEYLASEGAIRAATEAVISRPPEYLVATTGIGIRAWFEAAQVWGLGEELLDALAPTRVVARGPKAAAAVHTAGLLVWASPDSERLDDVVDLLVAEGLAGRTVAFQHYGERNDAAVEALKAADAQVVDVPIYRWQPPDDRRAALRLVEAVCDGRVDAVTFTSAPAVQNLVAVAAEAGVEAELLAAFNHGGAVAACVGPVCAEAARLAGLDHPIAPQRGRLGLLVRTVAEALESRRHALCLAGCRVIVQGHALSIDDQPVHLPGQEEAVFRALLNRRGAVVSKPGLLRTLGDNVSPHALETTIARLRRRMGPAGQAIRSVPRRGYLLDAGVGPGPG